MIEYEQKMIAQMHGWREKIRQVPFLKFPAAWEASIIPPFGGADARFRVRKGSAEVSVYLDFDGNLGYMDRPYWEIHPIDGDCARYYLDEADDLLKGIAKSIRQQNKQAAP